jgi:ribosomal protein S18 acetylase RimI-like enzyme
MTDALLLREATANDLPAVLALYAQPGLDDGRVLPPEQAHEVFAQFTRYPSYRLFVACNAAGQVLGSYALLVMHNLAHQGAPSAIVEDVVVDQRCRSCGIGRRMMDHARLLAREAGAYKLALSSNQKRERAHAFYDSLGFQRHGISFVITP